ncbi:hypothetical protein M8Z33_19725 [Streptomyces sp. ZAF1911]|uniref:hypothetical protein n=1 Tax=Streptomyces sp. ZAF1911 TaxID=2944129 RepID=UPI00237B5E9F|nr:hypothetical protein [Streptomyces sp. ZAF1911]MDD9378848.1 hypothetical protein [Streptomyces sp. ZAF1911]
MHAVFAATGTTASDPALWPLRLPSVAATALAAAGVAAVAHHPRRAAGPGPGASGDADRPGGADRSGTGGPGGSDRSAVRSAWRARWVREARRGWQAGRFRRTRRPRAARWG